MYQTDPTATRVPLPDVIRFYPWFDPDVEVDGWRFDSAYVEYVWLPVLGPTATWLLRHIGAGLVSIPPPPFLTVRADELATHLGIGGLTDPRLSKGAPLPNAVTRLRHFGVASLHDDGGYSLRLWLPDVPQSRRLRLDPISRRFHHTLSLQRPDRRRVS